MGKNYKEFAEARKSLENLLGGRIELDEQTGRWSFRRGNQKFTIGVTSEGVKKISILDTLLSNRFLDTNSIIFIDEPESALHPSAVSQLLEIIALMATRGVQIFLASHSYFVVKKLYLLAQELNMRIPLLSDEDDAWIEHDLLNGIPDNSIMDESIRLYEEEVDRALS
jgi:predicted ATPase